jgi:cytochrome c biogenesis protein CcdA
VLSALPMAFVMIAGPQIITAIMLATSKRAKANSLGFLAGVALATTAGLTAFYFLTGTVHHGSHGNSGASHALNVVAVVALVALGVLVFQRRANTDPPAWMAKLQEATPGTAFKMGFILFAVMPTDLITMFTVANLVAHAQDPWWHTLLFMALTVVFAGLPLIVLVAMGARAEVLLPKARDWMATNSWIVSEVLVTVFLLMSLNDLFG